MPARAYLWELSAGRIDPGENALGAAKRELKEETGYKAKRWTRLCHFYGSPGYVAEKMTIYLAEELTEGVATPMGDERIETRWFKLSEIAALIESGEIVDAKTIVGYTHWKMLSAKRKKTARLGAN